MDIKPSARLNQMGSAIFSEMGQWKRQAEEAGKEIIDLGIGSPDRPPSEAVMQALQKAVTNPQNYGYPTSEGSPAFRQAVCRWYKHRFDVDLDAEREVLALMGSQDGLAHLGMAVAEPGDLAMVPDPGYPIYSASLVLAGVTPYFLPLREENGFLPDLDAVPADVAERCKFLLLNYPSNPVSAVAELEFFQRVVDFARKHSILVAHDLAYSELAFDGFRPASILQIPGAREVAVEFHSLSKSFQMAGCRIAFMVGNEQAVKALRMLKSNIDYGIFLPIQEAGIAALDEDIAKPHGAGAVYEKRRDAFLDELERWGWHIPKPKATMFVWAKIPSGWTSRQISREILENTGVVMIPGDAFGQEGEGYVRIALVREEKVLVEAARRIGRFLQERR